jgi:hypothetical protein
LLRLLLIILLNYGTEEMESCTLQNFTNVDLLQR